MKKTLALSAVLVLGIISAACPGDTNTANNSANNTKANNTMTNNTTSTPMNVSTPSTMPVNNTTVNKAVNDMKETTNKATNDMKESANKVANAVNKKP